MHSSFRAMSTDQVKMITLVANNFDLVAARRWIAACALGRDVRVLSFAERRSRFSTKLDVTVAGHPRRIREFYDDVRGDAWTADSGGDLADAIIFPILVEGARAIRRKWQSRHDPPLDRAPAADERASRTIVFWKWEEARAGGEPVGPVWVETYVRGEREPVASEEWPNWARRSDAVAYAREHGFDFLPDE
jgi:hypothetical protein